MASTPLKVLLFIAGALIAGSGAAYFAGAFDPVANGGQEMAGPSDPAGPARPPADEGSAPETGARLTDGEDTSGERSEAAKDDVIVPAFDIVRVEPDGSLVVAGRAAPGSEVEIVSGSSVLATARAGPSGDFAAVLDEELKPGEHNIVLRSTSSDHVAATSRETAVVSVPNAESGEVVALVQEPGEPSRLISVPQGGEGSGNRQGSGADEKVASRNPAEPVPEEDGRTGAEGAGDRPSAAGDAAGTVQAGGQDAGQAADAREDGPSGEAERSGGLDEAGAEAAGEPGQNAAAAERGEGEAAEGSPVGPASGDASQPHAPFIEAVEIDGRDVFVAGRAKPGHQVRVYFNDLLIGQTRATPAGRFLVQAERELPVGDYIVRADVLDEDGATVIARAAVPFERQTGDNVAAVAPGATRVEGGRPGAGVDGDSQGDEGAAGDGEADGTPGTAAGGEEQTADMAPRLEPADGSVIIRRGDTLWEISRRVYGRGVRYTTIYLANQDQIEDPDLIWPGQIFNLPEETEEGEAADLSAIGEQAAQPSEPVRESSR